MPPSTIGADGNGRYGVPDVHGLTIALLALAQSDSVVGSQSKSGSGEVYATCAHVSELPCTRLYGMP